MVAAFSSSEKSGASTTLTTYAATDCRTNPRAHVSSR